MNISFVLAVYNNLSITKECYKYLRELYPTTPLVISSGGSNDGTKEWLESLMDENLSFIHDDDKLPFSDTYNAGIKLVDTEKLVLIHNDMVIGHGFLEALEEDLDEKTLLCYTTVEPPIFKGHIRPGKEIMDLGSSFLDFRYDLFNQYLEQRNRESKIVSGGTFFMSGYKKLFEDVGHFDGFSFFPAFCEDDDFIIRTKLKGYDLKTTNRAVVYHFVSQTSRFSEEFKHNRIQIEMNSNRNFVRKWGLPISMFNEIRYWEDSVFVFKTFSMGLTTRNRNRLFEIEPFFDKIDLGEIPEDYIEVQQKTTNYDLRSKFLFAETVDVMVYEEGEFTPEDIMTLYRLRLSIPQYDPGEYRTGNMKIEIKRKV